MAYYSIKGNVYHLYPNCYLGNNIEKENLKEGTGHKKLCDVCKKMKEKKAKK